MNSTTGDMTEAKRSSFEDYIRERCRSSTVKKKKIFNLAPLNLNEMRKELEAATNEKPESTCNPTSETTEAVDCVDNILKDVSNYPRSQKKLEDGIEHVDKNETEDIIFSRSNIKFQKIEEVPIVQSQKCYISSSSAQEVSSKDHHDDSFQLDLSVLSLQTPIKSAVQLGATPTVYKSNSKLETPNMTKPIPTKLHFTLPKNPFVTPNPMRNSSIKTFTPFLSSKKKPSDSVGKRVICSIPRVLPKDETFNKIVVKNTEYLILNLLGRGGSSEVYQCYCLASKLLVAIKCVSLHDQASSVGYINEVELLQQLQDCDKIIRMYDFEIVESQKKLYMVLERGGDDLSSILRKLSLQSSHLPLYTLLFYWMNMLHAVKQIHMHGVIHSDLKPANFINTDNGLKLIDFGIASAVQNDETSVVKTRSEGSCNYISPEALNSVSTDSPNSKSVEGKYKLHFKSDVWSLGCILYEMVYRKTPFHQFNKIWSKLAYILNPDHKIDYPEVDWVPPKLLNSIKSCLQYNEKARPSVDQLIGEYELFLK